tara:strand:+ start:625 stop:819 length:195 start_codon:yes stop_codon:yes gene_type:complete
MKIGDLVVFNNPVDQIVWEDKIGLLISFYYNADFHDHMAYILLQGETELYDFPTSCLEVLSAVE